MTTKPFYNGWMLTVIIVTALVCVVFVFANLHPYTLRFEMDDNTLEAFKSINYSAISEREDVKSVSWITCGGGAECVGDSATDAESCPGCGRWKVQNDS